MHSDRLGRADARARLARFCLAVAAGGARGIAGDLVAVAGGAPRAAPPRLSGDPIVARPDPARGDAGPHPVVADPAAHRARRAGRRRAGPSGAEPAEPAGWYGP